MRRHWNRSIFYVIGKGELKEPNYFLNGQAPPSHSLGPSTKETAEAPNEQPIGKFGPMFPDLFNLTSQRKPDPDPRIVGMLVELGKRMNDEQPSADAEANDSTLLAGYTYLGQFIAHEISFDKTKSPLVSQPDFKSYRSPQIDLDSVYGLGPIKERELYQDSARLKIGETVGDAIGVGDVKRTFQNDLPRAGYGSDNPALASTADPRNDDNLATAQMHVAFIKFHNKVVDALQARGGFRKELCPRHPEGCPPNELFECARTEVVQHFQAIILTDFLPRILDEKGMTCINSRKSDHFKVDSNEGLFMPLEFSVAAFRFGHSMVRPFYQWNYFQSSDNKYRNGAPKLSQLFQFTRFSGDLGGAPRLRSDWIIDWRRFFDFDDLGYLPDTRKKNLARKIDTAFNLHLDKIEGYPHEGVRKAYRSITVRNLLRGYSLYLPTGEQVAECINETPLGTDEIASGPYKDLLSDEIFRTKTPLWFYVLKEAELNNLGANPGTLGPVGSCIVAETLLGLIKSSPYSIFNVTDWRPRFGVRTKDPEFRRYEMADLLDYADVVDPIGEYVG
jgi:hypothetical protein